MRWTKLRQERGQVVLEFTNTFHTLRTKLGIEDSKRHFVLKYRGALHRYIQTEMDFLDMSSLDASYRYAIKIEQKFKHQKKWEFVLMYLYVYGCISNTFMLYYPIYYISLYIALLYLRSHFVPKIIQISGIRVGCS